MSPLCPGVAWPSSQCRTGVPAAAGHGMWLFGSTEVYINSPGCWTGGDEDFIHAVFMDPEHSASFMDNPYLF